MANWYIYTGVGDPTVPTSYRRMDIKPSCTGTGGQICAIYLGDTSDTPGSGPFALAVNYIINSLGTLTSQPTGAGVKRFVYVRCACP